jgi:hypothetical protein
MAVAVAPYGNYGSVVASVHAVDLFSSNRHNQETISPVDRVADGAFRELPWKQDVAPLSRISY